MRTLCRQLVRARLDRQATTCRTIGFDHLEIAMPVYRVWYRDNTEPLQFAAASRCSESAILDHIFEHEQIQPVAASDVMERIEKNNLGQVRYTEDESEMNVIA
jgi:hypothetical protein